MRIFFIAFMVFLTAGYCIADIAEYSDGVYEGEHSFVKVRVTVENGKITEIEILRHGGGGKKYAEMIKPLIDEVIEKQSTEIDAITGATVSSRNFKAAVEDALRKAAR